MADSDDGEMTSGGSPCYGHVHWAGRCCGGRVTRTADSAYGVADHIKVAVDIASLDDV